MEYTSAQANKLLKKLQEEHEDLLNVERQSYFFVAATTEDIELARPAYDYAKVQEKLLDLEKQIRHVKHCINVFNTTNIVEGFDMTIDQILVYIPQLTRQKEKLGFMASSLEKKRLTNTNRTNLIEYQFANYELKKVQEDYAAVSDELTRAQIALDRINTTKTMEI